MGVCCLSCSEFLYRLDRLQKLTLHTERFSRQDNWEGATTNQIAALGIDQLHSVEAQSLLALFLFLSKVISIHLRTSDEHASTFEC